MDRVSKSVRSKNMAKIRSKKTAPEDRLYGLLWESIDSDMEIQRNREDLPGRPDFLIPELSVIVFMDGCFFHCCPKHGHIPKSNIEYWKPKLALNAKRDTNNRRKLRRLGYAVWRFWEHDVKKDRIRRTQQTLQNRLRKRQRDLGGM